MAKIAAKKSTCVITAPEPPPLGDWAAAYAKSTMNSVLRICGAGVGTAHGFYSISAEKPSAECLEAAFEDRHTHVGQESQIEGQIVQRQQAVHEKLARREQVAQIRPREEPARLAAALGVERCCVAGEPRVADRDGPIPGERLAVARIARRHDAVEHVHAAGHALDE